MFCTQCGSKNAPESKFCTNCGNPLVSVPVQPDAGQARISDDFSVDSTAVETPASQLAPQSAEQPEQSAAQHEERPAEQLASQPAYAIPPVPLPGGTLPVAQSATSAASQSVPSAPGTPEPESDGTARAASRIASSSSALRWPRCCWSPLWWAALPLPETDPADGGPMRAWQL